MKRLILFALLVISLVVYNNAQAQFDDPKSAWGISLGGVRGDNSSKDEWRASLRGFMQFRVISTLLQGQIGLGYNSLEAPGVYGVETVVADARLLLIPFSWKDLNPFIYAGLGVGKNVEINNSDYMPLVPFGIGIHTMLSSQLLLQVSGGYTLCLSDKLDHRERGPNDLNSITNGKQDGYFGLSVGLMFTIGGDDKAAEEARRVKAEQDELRARELAVAEARRVQEATAAETRRVQEATAAEARRVQEANAAEALRIKNLTDAEKAAAKRVEEANAAEARRLAEQKSADTVFVLVKGKTVVLKGVNFEFNKATLTPVSEKILWRAYNAMVANPTVRVVITGHTDNIGGQKFNQTLSLKRAQAVKNWLVKKGIASNRMRTVGRGQNEPIATNDTEDGRSQNRRMEFYVQ